MDKYESIVMAEVLEDLRRDVEFDRIPASKDFDGIMDDLVEGVNDIRHDDLTVSTKDTLAYLFSHHWEDEVDWTLPMEEVVWYADGVIREHIVNGNAGTILRALDEYRREYR